MTFAVALIERVIVGVIVGNYGGYSLIALLMLRRLPRRVSLDGIHPTLDGYEAVLREDFIWKVRLYAGIGVLLLVGMIVWSVADVVRAFLP